MIPSMFLSSQLKYCQQLRVYTHSTCRISEWRSFKSLTLLYIAQRNFFRVLYWPQRSQAASRSLTNGKGNWTVSSYWEREGSKTSLIWIAFYRYEYSMEHFYPKKLNAFNSARKTRVVVTKVRRPPHRLHTKQNRAHSPVLGKRMKGKQTLSYLN